MQDELGRSDAPSVSVRELIADILLSNDTFYENSDLLEIVVTNVIAGAASVATWLFGASVYRLTVSNADRVQGVFM